MKFKILLVCCLFTLQVFAAPSKPRRCLDFSLALVKKYPIRFGGLLGLFAASGGLYWMWSGSNEKQREDLIVPDPIPPFLIDCVADIQKNKDLSRKPRIVLVPDNHTAPEAREKRSTEFMEAGNKKIGLLIEGRSSLYKSGNIYGMEDSSLIRASGLVAATLFNKLQAIQQTKDKNFESYVSSLFISNMEDPKNVEVLIEKTIPALRKSNDPKVKTLLDLLNELSKNIFAQSDMEKNQMVVAFAETHETLFKNSRKEIGIIMEQWTKDCLQEPTLIQGLTEKKIQPTELLSLLATRDAQELANAKKTASRLLINSPARNESIAKNSMTAFCDFAKSGIDTHISVGANHTAVLYQAIRASLDMSQGQDIEVVIDDECLSWPASKKIRKTFETQWKGMKRLNH